MLEGFGKVFLAFPAVWGVIHQPLALLEPVLHVLPASSSWFNSTLEFIRRQREYLENLNVLEIREWGLFLEFFLCC